MQKTKLHHRIHAHIDKRLQKRIQAQLEKHGHHRIHHMHHIYHHIGHNIIHLGEMIVAMLVGVFFILGTYASHTLLPNNTSLVYPISDIAKLECRPGVWNEIDSSCIMKLPRIKNANYKKYTQDEKFHFYYSVLWRATYKDGWDPDKGGHAGVDIPNILGTPIYSVAAGKVYYAGWQNGYGNVVKIKFMYQGKPYYAVYAHTNKIFVKKGQVVHQGQKIAEVGNTGMTFGGGGGYHLHFEINREKNGRLEYYLTGCPDKHASNMKIVNQGLCRKEIGEHQLDPIKFLEDAHAQLVETTVIADKNIKAEERQAEEKQEEKQERTTAKVEQGKVEEKLPEEKTHASAPEKIVITDESGLITTGNLVTLELDHLSDLGKHFFSQYDLKIYTSLLQDAILDTDHQHKIILTLVKKSDKEVYQGLLKTPINLITSNNKVMLSYHQISLFQEGKATIDVDLNKKGKTAILINLGDEKIAVLKYTIN